MENIDELRGKIVDIRPFKRDFVIPDEATIASVRVGFQFSMWHKDRIPAKVNRDLALAYPLPPRPNRFRPAITNNLRLLVLEKYDEAVKSCDSELAKDPDDALLYYHKCAALLMLDKYKDAAECCQSAFEADPNSLDMFYKTCALFSISDRHKEAAECYKKAIYIDPSVPALYLRMGNMLARLEKYNDAMVQYDEAIYIDSELSGPHMCKGDALCSLGRYGDAMPYYDEAIRLDPDNSYALCRKGDALEKLGRHDDAMPCRNAATYNDLSNLGDYNRAPGPAECENMLLYHDESAHTGRVLYRRGDMVFARPGGFLFGMSRLICAHVHKAACIPPDAPQTGWRKAPPA